MAGYQLCRGAAACQEQRIVASPNHVEIYLATSTMTFQFKESKLREDGEVPHAVGIEKGDALDGPAKIKCEVLCVVNGRRTGMPSNPARAAFLCAELSRRRCGPTMRSTSPSGRPLVVASGFLLGRFGLNGAKARL